MHITVSVTVGEERWSDDVHNEALVVTEHLNPAELPWGGDLCRVGAECTQGIPRERRRPR